MNTPISINNNKTDRQTNVTVNTIIPSSSSLHQETYITPVYLNLYDLGGCINASIHSIGLLFYHCAVQAHSAEYGYMGHPYKFTGLYKTSKHDSRFHLYRLRDSIEVGWTWFSEKEIDQIVNNIKPFYLGFDYHTINKNSIHFAKYLLEQLSNDPVLKHLEPIKIIDFPSYIDRGRRLSHIFEFLQIFDREKDIAEINILYFLYMNYEGNIKQICQILKCDTIDKLKRCIQLIEQGIQQNKLPIFSNFTKFQMKTAHDYLYIIDQNNSDISSINEQLTLTDIFHQFDTITLRGRTSIDRYLNIQRAKELAQHSQIENEQQSITMKNVLLDRKSILFDHQQGLNSSHIVEIPHVSNRIGAHVLPNSNDPIKQKNRTSSIKYNEKNTLLSHIHRPSLSQALSQNQGRTPLTSLSGSNISEIVIQSSKQSDYPSTNSAPIIQTTPVLIDPYRKLENLHMRTVVPVGTVLRLQDEPNPDLPLNELHLTTDDHHSTLSLIANRQRKNSYSSRKRKLPRDLELSNDLYTITNQNSIRHNYTNNATSTISSFSQC
ncbi:unnamed protein product [Rotaria sp. Silwood1]|nr:unnamed protein product [Rotaria sp. Silwood1]CAF0866066.1 unnamed protein product [Rotaria sp. Silwood1]CAF4701454.1 unnamed protein product [Rotaria sp. Silwood1]